MTKQPKSWRRPEYTKEQKQLGAKLADPKVDEAFAAEQIKQGCEEIQAHWDEAEEFARRGLKITDKYETPVVPTGDRGRKPKHGSSD